MGIWGQDWASYQSPNPDVSGINFAFIKVTEGLTYVNPHWEAQRAHAHAAGLVVGLYAYPHMANSPQAELQRFLQVAQPVAGELLCLDWEGYDSANQTVSRSRQFAYKEDWLHRAATAAPHNATGMYCNVDYWRNVDTTGFFGDFLWIATADRAAGDPGIQAPWLFHQYSAAGVDRDFCRLPSTAALKAWAMGFAAPPVTPPPAPAPSPVPPLPFPLKESKMLFLVSIDQATVPSGTAWPGVFLLAPDLSLRHVTTPADEKSFKAAGITGPFTISYAQYQGLLAGH